MMRGGGMGVGKLKDVSDGESEGRGYLYQLRLQQPQRKILFVPKKGSFDWSVWVARVV